MANEPGASAAPPNHYAFEPERMHGAELPSTYINRWMIGVGADEPIVRIAFGEKVGDEKYHHFAITMTKANSKWFAQMLLDLLKQSESAEQPESAEAVSVDTSPSQKT